MQIDRLFGIVYLLLQKKALTAAELAERFEVSVRTIYRDIEVLTNSGIPIYTTQGKGGGISILENFVLNKSVLSDEEQKKILMALETANAAQSAETGSLLQKLGCLFQKSDTNWIEVDFSDWNQNQESRQIFDRLKQAIPEHRVISFVYHSTKGESFDRIVEPLKLVFKGQSWYLYGYCRKRQDFRFFKLTRIEHLHILAEIFSREMPSRLCLNNNGSYTGEMIPLVLKIDSSMSFRVYDEFWGAATQNEGGSFLVHMQFPKGDWLYGYLLSFGDKLEVLAPEEIRDGIKKILDSAKKKYKT